MIRYSTSFIAMIAGLSFATLASSEENPVSCDASTASSLLLRVCKIRNKALVDTATENIKSKSLNNFAAFQSEGVQLDVSTKDTVISAALAKDSDFTGSSRLSRSQLGVTFSAPIEKGETRSNFITNSGLASDFETKLAWSFFTTKPTKLSISPDKLIEFSIDAQKRCERDNPNKDKQHCLTGNFDEARYKAYFDEDLLNLISNDVKNNTSPMFFAKFEASLGFTQSEYFDMQTLNAMKEDKIPYSLNTTLGVLPVHRGTFFGLGLLHKVTYKNTDEETICIPEAGDGEKCQTGSFSKPERDKDFTGYAVLRYQKAEKPLALEIRAGYDFEDKVFGIEAPIYLFEDKNRNLRGGVKLAWSDKEDTDTEIGIFLGSRFNFFSGAAD